MLRAGGREGEMKALHTQYLLVQLTHSNLDPHSKKLLLHLIRAENEQGHPRKQLLIHYPLHNLQDICNKTLPRAYKVILHS